MKDYKLSEIKAICEKQNGFCADPNGGEICECRDFCNTLAFDTPQALQIEKTENVEGK